MGMTGYSVNNLLVTFRVLSRYLPLEKVFIFVLITVPSLNYSFCQTQTQELFLA